MADRRDSESFVLTPPDHQDARRKDSLVSSQSRPYVELKDTEAGYKRVKSDFLQIAQNHRRQSELSRSESSRSPAPAHRRNIPKFKIATFYPTDVELWFDQTMTNATD